MQFRRWCIFRTAARADNQVNAGQLMLVQSERLTDDPADTVTFDTAARGTNRNGKTNTRPTLVVPEGSHTKESVAKLTSASVGRIEVGFATQTPLRGQSKPCWGRAVGGQGAKVLWTSVLSTGAPSPTRAVGRAQPTCAPSCEHVDPQRVMRLARGMQPEVRSAQPERVAARNKRRGCCHALWNELSAALSAAACQYGAAILRSHTCPEPVGARTPHFARLIGALHSMDSVDGPWVPKRAARLSR
jgi:hypothetical protein